MAELEGPRDPTWKELTQHNKQLLQEVRRLRLSNTHLRNQLARERKDHNYLLTEYQQLHDELKRVEIEEASDG